MLGQNWGRLVWHELGKQCFRVFVSSLQLNPLHVSSSSLHCNYIINGMGLVIATKHLLDRVEVT